MSKKALILGIGGMDGSYLADILLERGYTVGGFHRHSSYDNLARIAHCRQQVQLFRGDVTDRISLRSVLGQFKPDEIYHVADQDNVGWSFAAPDYQHRVTAASVVDLLACCLDHGKEPKLFVPLSATMFGMSPPPQSETAKTDPNSPYANNKLIAWHNCRNAREMGIKVYCGIMFNHDSPRRARGYLLQDICRQAVTVSKTQYGQIVVGSLDTRVDVGYARDYMEAAVDMLQLPEPGDYCIGTGEAWTIRLMIDHALDCLGFGPAARECMFTPWERGGDGRVREDPARVGTGPQPSYQADIRKARAAFGFVPKTNVGQLVEMLVDHFRSRA